MNIYRVRVKCTHEPYKDAPRRKNWCYEECLVEAASGSSAMEIGSKFIEDKAPNDVRWVEFLPLSAACLEFPTLIV